MSEPQKADRAGWEGIASFKGNSFCLDDRVLEAANVFATPDTLNTGKIVSYILRIFTTKTQHTYARPSNSLASQVSQESHAMIRDK